MIAEQDFILRIRRMNRLSLPQTVFNVVRRLSDYNGADADETERNLRTHMEGFKGEVHVMGNGDVFFVLPLLKETEAAHIKESLLAIAFPEGTEEDKGRLINVYRLPQDYTALREKVNAYVEVARATEVMGPLQQAVRALQAPDVRGPLTAYSLAQVEKLIENIDIRRYVRTQPVYSQDKMGVWAKDWVDFYVSVSELKKERFPYLNVETPERLFLELCYTLDRKLLFELGVHAESWADKSISLNLSAETVLSSAFAQFCKAVTQERRNKVTFDIHRSDLFLNFSTTRNAIDVLKHEGFHVGIDGITPAVLPYINFHLLAADYYKINVTKEKWMDSKASLVRESLAALPAEKIVFSHCDHDEALREGQKWGVKYFQGWLIDDVTNALPS